MREQFAITLKGADKIGSCRKKVIKLSCDDDLYSKIVINSLYKITKKKEFVVNNDNLLIILSKIFKYLKNISLTNIDYILDELNIKTENIFLNLTYLQKRTVVYDMLGLKDINFNENLHIKFILDI